MAKKLKLNFNIKPENQKWIICGLIVILVLVVVWLIYNTNKKEKYIFGLSDEEKCNKNSR